MKNEGVGMGPVTPDKEEVPCHRKSRLQPLCHNKSTSVVSGRRKTMLMVTA